MKVTCSFEISEKELELYKKKVEELNGGTLDNVAEIIVESEDDGHVKLTWVTNSDDKKIERIRRITGYLTGDTSRWNNAKQAEEAERVKHG